VHIAYIGGDYPAGYDVELPAAELTFTESAHYAVDAPLARCEWISARDVTRGQGQVRAGPDMRAFGVGMVHQLHCLNLIRMGIVEPPRPALSDHVQHCLNYLRQLLLCTADAALEPGDFVKRDYARDRMATTRQCRDWGTLYGSVAENYDTWLTYSDLHGSEYTIVSESMVH
jgi:hypothetical protein